MMILYLGSLILFIVLFVVCVGTRILVEGKKAFEDPLFVLITVIGTIVIVFLYFYSLPCMEGG